MGETSGISGSSAGLGDAGVVAVVQGVTTPDEGVGVRALMLLTLELVEGMECSLGDS